MNKQAINISGLLRAVATSRPVAGSAKLVRNNPWLASGAAGTGLSSLEYGYYGLGRNADGADKPAIVPRPAERVITALMHTLSMRKFPQYLRGGGNPFMTLATAGGSLFATPAVNSLNTGGRSLLNLLENSDRTMKDTTDFGGLLKALASGEAVTMPDGTVIKAKASMPEMVTKVDSMTKGLQDMGAAIQRTVPTGIGAGLGYLIGSKVPDAVLPTHDEAKRRRRLVIGQLAGAGLGGLAGYIFGGGDIRLPSLGGKAD